LLCNSPTEVATTRPQTHRTVVTEHVTREDLRPAQLVFAEFPGATPRRPHLPGRSGHQMQASKLTSSSRRSITVDKRRAPMFSVRSFTSKAICASRVMPSQQTRRHLLGGQQGLVLLSPATHVVCTRMATKSCTDRTATPPGSENAPATRGSGRWVCSGGTPPRQ
jgi:hypothetical protein